MVAVTRTLAPLSAENFLPFHDSRRSKSASVLASCGRSVPRGVALEVIWWACFVESDDGSKVRDERAGAEILDCDDCPGVVIPVEEDQRHGSPALLKELAEPSWL